jgi:hypothetical protein
MHTRLERVRQQRSVHPEGVAMLQNLNLGLCRLADNWLPVSSVGCRVYKSTAADQASSRTYLPWWNRRVIMPEAGF